MRELLLLMLLGLLISAPAAHSATLSIKSFLDLADKNDLTLKKLLSDERKLRYIMNAGLPSQEFLFEFEKEKGFSTQDNDDTSVLRGSFSKEIIQSGTTLSVSRTETTRPDRKEEVTEFRIEQDVFQNFFGQDVRLKQDSLRKEEEVVKLEVLNAYEDYIATILSNYLDYQKSFIDLQVANVALKDAERLRKNVRLKKAKNIATQTDLDKVSLQVLLREEDKILRERNFEQRREEIGQIIGEVTRDEPSLRLFALLYDFYKKVGKTETDPASLLEQRISELKYSASADDLKIARRERYPELTLFGGYDIDNSERFSSVVNRKEAIIGMSLSLPIWDTVQNAKVESAALTEFQADLDRGITKKLLATQKETLRLKLAEQELKRRIINEKVILSERILKAEKRRYNYGRVELDDIIELESNFVRYQFQRQSEELELGKAILEWLALNDKLLQLKNSL